MSLPEKRKQLILDYLATNEFGDVSTFVELLNVSPATIRRDLTELADRGLIIRTHGGASRSVQGLGHEPSYHSRAKENVHSKQLIAQTATQFIHEGEVIAIDVGSSTLELAKHLRDYRKITVFTANILVADVLANSEVNVILVGGTLRKREMSVAGPIAVQIINQFYFDKFFLGTAGVSIEDGFTDFSVDDVDVKKAFVSHAKEIIALADHTKLGKVSFAKICPLSKVSHLITDSVPDEAYIEGLQNSGLDVVAASNSNRT
ncbi:MAG: DeoR/GlpR family DNA-binding transcription regulator [Anaerolineales bacterium]